MHAASIANVMVNKSIHLLIFDGNENEIPDGVDEVQHIRNAL
jgi:hypothetical protein